MTIFTTIKNGIKFHVIGITAIVLIAVIGLKVAENYGIAWDEYNMREYGYMDYNYITQKGLHKPNPFYGPVIELPLVILEVKLGITDYKSIFVMRHVVCHLLFIIGAIALYFSVFLLFKKRFLALLGLLFYFTFPTLYAHSFFNSKDTTFLSLFSILFLFWVLALKNPKWIYFCLVGIITGLVINSRIIGVVAIPAIGLSLLLAIIYFPNNYKPFKTILQFCVSVVIAFLVLYASWPLLWNDPVHQFIDILTKSSNYTFFGADTLFNGAILNSNKLPFWYLPAWMGITIPLVVQAFAFIGFGASIVGFIKLRNANKDIVLNLFQIALTVSFVLPFMAVILLHSPIFDSWRHMYFLYVMVIYFAIYGFNYVYENAGKIFKNVGLLLIGVHAVLTLAFMVQNHPFQNVYFNELVSKSPENIRTKYDFDFWGTSYRQGLEFILSDNKSDSIRVLTANSPGSFNQFILSNSDRHRLVYVDSIKDADYFISNYRWHPQEYELKNRVFRKVVSGSTIVAVWKVEESDRSLKLKIIK